MALTKRVKQGGSYYQGNELIVSSAPADYILDIVQTGAATINSLSVTPDTYGQGDTFDVQHLSSDTQTVIALLANNINNLGKNVSILFDLPALELMDAGDILRLSYTNTASEALAVHTIVEYVGLTRTA